jgi:Domain of unknown function (DUF4158)
MSTGEEVGTPERFLTTRQRRNPLTLPVDPTDEELARDWTLSEADKVQVLHCRGEAHRRSFALQLCVLRKYGRFLTEYDTVPGRIINHLGHQLGLSPVLFVDPPRREATDLDHEWRIREYLGFRPFDPGIQEKLEDWIRSHAAEEVLSAELFERAEGVLRSWKIVLPAPSTLERIVASVSTRARQHLFDHIAGRLTPQICQVIDDLLQVPEGDHRSTLFQFKDYPPAASAAAITAHIERYHLLHALGVGQINLDGIPSAQVHHLAQLANRYDARALKRFAPVKRHAMVACFLVEIQKTILDHVVAMHDQLVTTMTRRSRNAFEKRHRELRPRAKKGLDTLLAAIEILLGSEQSHEVALGELYRQIKEAALREARDNCREFQRLEERGYLDALCAHYPHLRR